MKLMSLARRWCVGTAVGLSLGTGVAVAQDPLPSMVAVGIRRGMNVDLSQFMRARVRQIATGTLPANATFPLANGTSDTVRVLPELRHNVVVRWLDSLTTNTSPRAPRFGGNCDYIAYFGDGWNSDWANGVVGSAPQYNGSGSAGWVWVNFEYVSNSTPTPTSAPNGQALTFAKYLKAQGILTNDVTSNTWSQADIETFVKWFKKEHGGGWFRIARDRNGNWKLDTSAANQRFDASSDTLLRVTGQSLQPLGLDHDDKGQDLPAGVVAGIIGDCSGGQSPWGTVITAEENVQGYYGDLETAWSSSGLFLPGNGFDPGSDICPIYEASRSGSFGRHTFIQERHNRDVYGYLVEMDPADAAPNKAYDSASNNGDGKGHRKIGAAGRARWENATFVTGKDWRLIDGQPIVIYASNDRRGGRIYKFVSSGVYRSGMTKAQVRALIDDGEIYAAHFDGLDNATGLTLLSNQSAPTILVPGQGRWVHLSVDSTDIAPNAAALGKPRRTVGKALKNQNWNGVGGFPNDDMVRLALYTAANKIGVMELNRPEDLEWNACDPSGTPRLYIAFTNHGRQVALDQDGIVFDPAEHSTKSPRRPDPWGAVFAIEEAIPGTPATSMTFKYFQVWAGTGGTDVYDAANPDNLMIDGYGGVWFGTDGNFGRNGTADAVYYLDLNPAHRPGSRGIVDPTYGRAFRIAAVPSDAEATGPAFSSDMSALFISVQHPGENFSSNPSTWPANAPFSPIYEPIPHKHVNLEPRKG